MVCNTALRIYAAILLACLAAALQHILRSQKAPRLLPSEASLPPDEAADDTDAKESWIRYNCAIVIYSLAFLLAAGQYDLNGNGLGRRRCLHYWSLFGHRGL